MLHKTYSNQTTDSEPIHYRCIEKTASVKNNDVKGQEKTAGSVENTKHKIQDNSLDVPEDEAIITSEEINNYVKTHNIDFKSREPIVYKEKRLFKCMFCGKIGLASEFGSSPTPGAVNTGMCRNCDKKNLKKTYSNNHIK